MADGAPEAPIALSTGDGTVLSVDIGRRVLVFANLRLTSEPTAASQWATAGLARALESWSGPGLVVVAGNLFDGGDVDTMRRALSAHTVLADAFTSFSAGEDRKVVVLPGQRDAALDSDTGRALATSAGMTMVSSVELRLDTAAGMRRVLVDATAPDHDAVHNAPPVAAVAPDPQVPWQHGVDRLVEPDALPRFLSSRLLYRRFARLAWWLLVPVAAAVAIRMPWSSNWLLDLFRTHPAPAHALSRARAAGWGPRLAVAAVFTVAELLILAAVLGLISRKAWRALGGGALPGPFDEGRTDPGATTNDAPRDAARAALESGVAGVISGATMQAELTDLRGGFFASCGAVGAVVEEHPGRLGLPPVFLDHRQMSWIELETGAQLHTRLLLARNDVRPSPVLERVAARYHRAHDAVPEVVAAHPLGPSWPPAPDLGVLRRRSRRVRRWVSLAIALAGLVDLLSALTPPLRERLHQVLQVLPLGATQAAGAIVAIAGIALLALARGVRRGQHRAWVIATALICVTLVLHIVRGGDIEESLLSALVLLLLVSYRTEFRAPADTPSTRSALRTLVLGGVAVTVLATVVVETVLRVGRSPHHFLPLWRVAYAVVSRLVGVQNVSLPDRLDDFLTPSLLAVGIGLALAVVLLATRPVVDRRLTHGRAAELRARDLVRRHGHGTLDYFALRSDKQWFFHRDSMVAYAIFGGVCVVAPDPIGPRSEREQVWGAFRRFADGQGWVVTLMGAAEDRLPTYRAAGMHEIYIGDEAVVDVQRFSLAGGHMKGLRQAHNRIAKYGYTATFHDPSRLDRDTAERLIPLLSQSRRGEFERGFSMMLGRLFDPRDRGLLLVVVKAPDGSPAAMCQFVPAPGIGGFSLDLMRRDRGEHPNGLIDFALVSSIEHLRDQGHRGLSMNFAAMRSILEGERGDGLTQRVERWALQKMSSFLQIETLWRFNAKYTPDWLPRYIVYDTAEHLVPAVMAVLRAEALDEVPVIGRMLIRSQRKAVKAAGGEPALSAVSLLPRADGGPDEEEPTSPADVAGQIRP